MERAQIYVIVTFSLIFAVMSVVTYHNYKEHKDLYERFVKYTLIQQQGLKNIVTDVNFNDRILNQFRSEVKDEINNKYLTVQQDIAAASDRIFKTIKGFEYESKISKATADVLEQVATTNKNLLLSIAESRKATLASAQKMDDDVLKTANKDIADLKALMNASLISMEKSLQTSRGDFNTLLAEWKTKLAELNAQQTRMTTQFDTTKAALDGFQHQLNTLKTQLQTDKPVLTNAVNRTLLNAVATDNRFVGIGTTAPTAALEVKGDKDTRIRISGHPSALELGNDQVGYNFVRTDVNGRMQIHSSDPNKALLLQGQEVGGKTGGVGVGVSSVPNGYNLAVRGRSGLMGNSALEFGAQVVGKDAQSGLIGYSLLSQDALDITGAGSSTNERKMAFWNEGGAEFKGPTTFNKGILVKGDELRHVHGTATLAEKNGKRVRFATDETNAAAITFNSQEGGSGQEYDAAIKSTFGAKDGNGKGVLNYEAQKHIFKGDVDFAGQRVGTQGVLRAGVTESMPMPQTMSTGLHASSVYANGPISTGIEGDARAYMTPDGDIVGRKSIKGERLCLGDTCISEDDLKAFVKHGDRISIQGNRPLSASVMSRLSWNTESISSSSIRDGNSLFYVEKCGPGLKGTRDGLECVTR